jgi:hypothetical protein
MEPRATGPAEAEPSLAAAVTAEIRADLARKKIRSPYAPLALYMGKHPKTIERILNDARPIDLDELQRIALFLEVDWMALMPRTAA